MDFVANSIADAIHGRSLLHIPENPPAVIKARSLPSDLSTRSRNSPSEEVSFVSSWPDLLEIITARTPECRLPSHATARHAQARPAKSRARTTCRCFVAPGKASRLGIKVSRFGHLHACKHASMKACKHARALIHDTNVHTCIHPCMHTYILPNSNRRAHLTTDPLPTRTMLCVCMHACMHACMCDCVPVCTDLRMYAGLHGCQCVCMYVCMDGWMDGCMMDGWIWMHLWMDGWMEGWMDVRRDGYRYMDGWRYAWMQAGMQIWRSACM